MKYTHIKKLVFFPLLLLSLSIGSLHTTMAAGFTDISSWSSYNPVTAGITPTSSYSGNSIFDGRYMYFIPYGSGSTPEGNVLRYDTQAAFGETVAWEKFDATTISPRAKGFSGASFDGRFIYFSPYADGPARDGEVVRYDTKAPFLQSTSWKTYDPGAHGVGVDPDGYVVPAFDGRYVYFAPFLNGSSLHGEVLRYDTQREFESTTSWTTFDTTTVNAGAKGYTQAIYDGKYVYFIPYVNGAYDGLVVRYDSSLPFSEGTSWTTFDPSNNGLSAENRGFLGAIFDGKYLYFTPYSGSAGAGGDSGTVLRYNTQAPFTDIASWSEFNATSLDSGIKGYSFGTFDGKYVYFSPEDANGTAHGRVLRYDTSSDFTTGSSWSFFDPSSNGLGAAVRSYQGVSSDGKYLYFSPTLNGEILRYTLSDTALDYSSTILSQSSVNASNSKMTLPIFPLIPLDDQSHITIDIPNLFASSIASFAGTDITTAGPVNFTSTAQVNATEHKISVALSFSQKIVAPFTIIIGDGAAGGKNDFTNPNVAGVYSIPTIPSLASGFISGAYTLYALVNNALPVHALVSDALIMNMGNNNLSFTVDPSVNNGEDSSQYTQLTVASNALNGYSVYGFLDDGTGNARLSNGSAHITSGTGENSFGFEAKNTAYTSNEVVAADSSFANVATLLVSNSTNISATGPTNNQPHTIYYDLNVDYLAAAGTYTGTITYTAIGNF